MEHRETGVHEATRVPDNDGCVGTGVLVSSVTKASLMWFRRIASFPHKDLRRQARSLGFHNRALAVVRRSVLVRHKFSFQFKFLSKPIFFHKRSYLTFHKVH